LGNEGVGGSVGGSARGSVFFALFSESNNSKEIRREGVFIFSDDFAIY
jgi:hypothetical protein